jgi:hypothetical protein
MRTISRRLPDKPVKRWNRNRMWYRVCPIKAYIACIFRRKQGFLGPIDLVDDFSQFSGSVLQDFSGELLIVTSFCMFASTMIALLWIMPFSIAISTVLLTSMSSRFRSFNRSFRNLVNELASITGSSGAIPRKYLKDISYLDRSTISTSDNSHIALSSKYLNIRIGSIAFLPLSKQ